MTIAAGFKCKDGVLLCADSQETIPDYLKMDALKVFVLQQAQHFRLGMTGAGDADLIDMTYQLFMKKFHRSPHDYDFIEQTIRDVMREVVRKYVIPYPTDERPWIHLLFALQIKDKPTILFKTSGMTVRRESRFACVGATALAHYLMSAIHFDEMPITRVRTFAISMLKHVKEFDPNCGKDSDVLILGDDWETHGFIDRDTIGVTENEMEAVDRCLKDLFVSSTNPEASKAEILEQLQHLASHIGRWRTVEKKCPPPLHPRLISADPLRVKETITPDAQKADAKSAGEGQ